MVGDRPRHSVQTGLKPAFFCAAILSRGGQPNNRSHASDTKLDVLLDAQRRYTATSSRKKAIDDIQRYCAEQVYYVYTPYPRNVSSWNGRVKNYGSKNSFDRGAVLEVVWLDA